MAGSCMHGEANMLQFDIWYFNRRCLIFAHSWSSRCANQAHCVLAYIYYTIGRIQITSPSLVDLHNRLGTYGTAYDIRYSAV